MALTGGAAIYGTCVANSAQIAVDEINALGGDIQFELMTEDDVNDAETSVNAYNALMDDGMQILVGTVTTQPALSVVPLSYEDRVFTLTLASGDDVISINDNDNVFQICFTDSNQGSRSAQYIDENFDSPKIAIIYKNDDQYSIGIRDNFKAEADLAVWTSSMRAPSPRPARPTSTSSWLVPSPPAPICCSCPSTIPPPLSF
ncbi:MAG: ABC transporter substrate-binding protein [Dysosmobacter welbionis]